MTFLLLCSLFIFIKEKYIKIIIIKKTKMKMKQKSIPHRVSNIFLLQAGAQLSSDFIDVEELLQSIIIFFYEKYKKEEKWFQGDTHYFIESVSYILFFLFDLIVMQFLCAQQYQKKLNRRRRFEHQHLFIVFISISSLRR